MSGFDEGYKKGYEDASKTYSEIAKCSNAVWAAKYEELAKQVPKRGKWKYNIGGTCTCSECGFSPSLMAYNFCPVCGADMKWDER